MDDLPELLDVVSTLYDSVIDESKWPEAMRRIAHFSSAHAAGHFVADPRAAAVLTCETVNIDPAFRSKYLEHYAARDIRLAPALACPLATPVTERMLVDQRQLERSEVFGDVLLPSDVPHFMLAWVRKQPDVMETFVIEGSRRRGAFDYAEMQRFSLVIPHLVRVMRLRGMLAEARESRRVSARALDALPFGFVFLNERGHVVETNAAAEALLSAADGLTLHDSCIRAVEPDSDRRLQAMIVPQLGGGARRASPKNAVSVARAAGRPLQVFALPVREGQTIVCPRTSLILLIVDAGRSPRQAARQIQLALSLTAAEARVAGALYTGVTLREAAEQLGISVNTCKTQLKSIYAKTGCRSHVELVKRMMLTLLGFDAGAGGAPPGN